MSLEFSLAVCVLWLNWTGDDIALNNLTHATINISSAKPQMAAKDGLYLELDNASSVAVTLNQHDADVTMDFDCDHLHLVNSKEVTQKELGSYINMAFYVEAVEEKTVQ